MNLWLRMLWVLLTTRWRGPLPMPFGVSDIGMIVLPNDLDVNLHVNNGRYLTLMDLGRLDIFMRSGLIKVAKSKGWFPFVSSVTIRFRHEMHAFQRFRIVSKLVYWTDELLVMEHRCIIQHPKYGETTAAVALLRGGVYNRKAKAWVSMATLLETMGLEQVASPPASPEVAAFLANDSAMKQAG